jgi:DNA-binding NtrC family response regulator
MLEASTETISEQMVGRSPRMRELAADLQRVMDTEIAVALFGETGTGKELAARALHRGSSRCTGPFIAINCAAIPPSLQESELFGHERGAFTGAMQSRKGAFELAEGGTLFLDELGEMSPSAQASLLRVLQEKKVRRLGGSSEIPVDVRIVSATCRDLEREVEEGRFRKDLYYRLVVYPIVMPPLRERADDIPALVAHIVAHHRETLRSAVESVHPSALAALQQHSWQGNVRELQNVICRAMVVCRDREIALAHLPREIQRLAGEPPAHAGAAATATAEPSGIPVASIAPDRVLPLHELERQAILQALRMTNGSVSRAARLLEIGRATLYRRMADQGISATSLGSP